MTKTNKLILLSTCLIFYFILLLSCRDLDMFFTIFSGNELLNGNFNCNPSTGLPIQIQQWLYAICMTKFHSLGLCGDMLFVFIQNFILWILSYKFIYKKTNNKYWSIICPILITIVLSSYMVNIRPQIITMIFLVSELLVLEKYKDTNLKRYLLWLIPIGILSANFHQAVYLYHIFIMIPYMYNYSDKKIRFDFNVITFSLIMFYLSAATPYGFDGMFFIFNVAATNVFNKINLIELAPVQIMSYNGFILIAIMLYVIISNYLHKSNKFINFYGLTMVALALISTRHLTIFYVLFLFIVSNKAIDIKIPTLYCISVFILTCLICTLSICQYKPWQKIEKDLIIGIDDIVPKDAHIYNTINIGSYLEYLGYNDIFIDARPEWYTEELCGENRLDIFRIIDYGLDEQNSVVSDEEFASHIEEFEYLIIRTNSPTERICKELDYIEEYRSGVYVIYRNKDYLQFD